MQANELVVQEKNGKTMLARAGVMLLPLIAMGGAHAEGVDTAGTVTAITALGAGVAAIGGAILLILVAIKGYSLIKRAL